MPIIMSTELEVLSVFNTIDRLKWSRSLFKPASFELIVNINVLDVSSLKAGNLLLVTEEERFGFSEIGRVYIIEQLEWQIGEDGKQNEIISIVGRGVGGMFEERVIIPPIGQDFLEFEDNAETVIKEFVKRTVGNLADVRRQIPNFVVAIDQQRGGIIEYKGRYEKLSRVLEDIGKESNIGWEVSFDRNLGTFIFEVVIPEDKTANSQTPVFLDVEFETILSQQLLQDEMQTKSMAIVGGEGEGAAREVIEVSLAQETLFGFDRKEIFVDAANLVEQEDLEREGRDTLRESEQLDIAEVSFNPVGSFRYSEDIDLGDIVVVQNRKWGLEINLAVVGITLNIERGMGQPDIDLQLGRTFPTLKTQVEREIGRRKRERV